MNQTEQSQVVQILSIVSGMLVPLGVIVTAILTYLNGRKITEVKAQNVQQGEKIETIQKQTDGINKALNVATDRAARAEGTLEGQQQQAAIAKEAAQLVLDAVNTAEVKSTVLPVIEADSIHTEEIKVNKP